MNEKQLENGAGFDYLKDATEWKRATVTTV
jgi:hypothetical protein